LLHFASVFLRYVARIGLYALLETRWAHPEVQYVCGKPALLTTVTSHRFLNALALKEVVESGQFVYAWTYRQKIVTCSKNSLSQRDKYADARLKTRLCELTQTNLTR
jgi:hypothetical protein